ncbi:MAG: glycosyltransferase family 4 protein [Gracilimonas sp.]|uniref:glycosyltransferase family 4 protein n=1 Tax=Gracilimonas sp. TaxID=1974203 RepID=UPI003752636C|nr:glycosyltransferase family 4 protein [Gracilimonas sp.]
MAHKKVLIITYYWPPSGGSGVQRWVKFTKYLREFGWEPVIYTPSNPERPAIDRSLSEDIPKDVTVLTRPIWEPHTFYKKIVGLKKDEKLGAGLMRTGNESSLFQDLSLWIRGNLFIPDSRKFWARPSVSFLKNYLIQNPVDAIISTGPPHSMHLIAMKISQNQSLPWLADFRDPWTNIDFFEDLKLSEFARKKHHKLEKKVLDSADNIVVVSPTMKKEFKEITDSDISVIPNGFDDADFSNSEYEQSSVFTISHIGMMSYTRNPEILWETLAELNNSEKDFKNEFKLQLIGKMDAAIRESIKKYDIEELVEIHDYVPHNEITTIQQKSDALLLIVNNTPNAALLLPGKLFEYLAAKRPIICISPVIGDIKQVMDETNSGSFILYSEKQKLKAEIMRLYSNWKNGISSYSGAKAEKYSRKSLTKKLSEELNDLTL